MSCLIASGYSVDCPKDNTGGLKRFLIAAKGDIDSVTETDGLITGITMKATKKFYEIQLVKSTSSFSTVPTGNEQTGSFFYAESATIIFNKMKAATSKFMTLSVGRLLFLLPKTETEIIRFSGRENGLSQTGGNAGSGVAGGDRNGYEITLTGEEKYISHVDPTIVAGLMVAAP